MTLHHRFSFNEIEQARQQTEERLRRLQREREQMNALMARLGGKLTAFFDPLLLAEPPLSRTPGGLQAQDPNLHPDHLSRLLLLYPDEVQQNPALPLLLLENPNIGEWPAPLASLQSWILSLPPDERRIFWSPIVRSVLRFSRLFEVMLEPFLLQKSFTCAMRAPFIAFFRDLPALLRYLGPSELGTHKAALERHLTKDLVCSLDSLVSNTGGKHVYSFLPSVVEDMVELSLLQREQTDTYCEERKRLAIEVRHYVVASWWRLARTQRG